MAAGLDGLLDFLLSEIALCGVQGASSKDFCRFVEAYYLDNAVNKQTTSSGQHSSSSFSQPYSRNFYEKAWRWVTTHPDIRIFDGEKTYMLSLSDLESLENEISSASNGHSVVAREKRIPEASASVPAFPNTSPSSSITSLRSSLIDRLTAEGSLSTQWSHAKSRSATDVGDVYNAEPHRTHKNRTYGLEQHDEPEQSCSPDESKIIRNSRAPRGVPEIAKVVEPAFDDLPSPIKCPRIFASQERVWQAVSGHSIDLKRLPSMEFICLCVIAIHGPSGITQPDLIKITGQDKRSVPKRTDELAKKGYIEKRPIQDGKLRTSLCVHKKFVKAGNFLTQPHSVDEVFTDDKFDFSGFVCLLHKLLTETPLLPMRELRKRMGVPLQKWYKRSVRSSLLRLESNEYIKRVQAPRKGSRKLLVCIKALREPTEDDIQSLRFKRGVPEPQDEELLEEDIEGDTLMRDLELDIMEESEVATGGSVDDVSRIPPQWTPDRTLGNLLFDATEFFGVDGSDTAALRDLTTGRFWKRPLESFLSRLADDWEKSQPPHLRHFSIVKDTMVTNDKKYAHFLYRTHTNFQKAVDAGDVDWRNVSKEAQTKAKDPRSVRITESSLDSWGFQPVDTKELYDQTGASDLIECRQAIVHVRKFGQRWDKALWEQFDFQKSGRSGSLPESAQMATSSNLPASRAKQRKTPKARKQKETDTGLPIQDSESILDKTSAQPEQPKKKAQGPIRLLTRDQRLALGLPPKGRLGAEIEEQIREHRRVTGDPTSIPDSILQNPSGTGKPKSSSTPLLTSEEREARGIPKTGRLSNALKDQIRQEKGLAIEAPTKKKRKPRDYSRKGPLLTSEQRKAKGLPSHGRLPEKIVAELRRLDAAGLDPFSIVLPLPDTKPSENALAYNLHNDTNGPSLEDDLASREQTSLLPSESPFQPSFATDISTPLSTIPQKRLFDELTVGSISPPRRVRSRTSTPLDMDLGQLARVEQVPSGFEVSKRKLGNDHSHNPTPSKKIRTSVCSNSPSLSGNHREKPNSSSVKTIFERCHFNIALPGVYVDANATRSVGRGRPRKAFMIIVKSTRLYDHDWFKQESDSASVIRYSLSDWQEHMYSGPKEPAQIPNIVSGTNGESSCQPDEQQVPLTSGPSADVDLALEKYPKTGGPSQQLSPPLSMSSPLPVQVSPEQAVLNKNISENSLEEPPIPPQHISPGMTEQEFPPPAEVSPQAQGQEKDDPPEYGSSMMPVQQVCAPAEPTINESLQEKIAQKSEQTTVLPVTRNVTNVEANRMSPLISELRNAMRPRVSPAGWVAVNTPNTTHPSRYQSPYASVPTQPVSLDPASDDIRNTAGIDGDGTNNDCQPLATLETPSSSADVPLSDSRLDGQKSKHPRRRRREDRNVTLGKGHLFNTRTSITRYILELCNGVFPLNGEIVYVYREVWKERAPKRMACPERSTIIRTLNDMINDPTQALVRYTFEYLSHTGNTAKRALVAFNHLAVTSPEVQKAYHGIRTAHPRKYFPPEVIQYIEDVQKPRANIVFEIDESVKLPETPSAAAKSLQRRIGKAIKEREQRYLQRQQKAIEEKRARNRAAGNTRSSARIDRTKNSGPGRARLAGLKAPDRSKTNALPSQETLEWPKDQEKSPLEAPHAIITAEPKMHEHRKTEDSVFESLRDEPASFSVSDHESISDVNHGDDDDGNDDYETEMDKHEILATRHSEETNTIVPEYSVQEQFTRPRIRFYPFSGTFSTEFHPFTDESDHSGTVSGLFGIPLNSPPDLQEGQRRVKSGRLSKKTRVAASKATTNLHENDDGPTLVERLTGLTGNANEPDYHPPSKKQKTFPTWSERKEKRRHRVQQKERKYAENPDPVQRFKTLFCTLVVASCMSGKDGYVNWDIVTKVYSHRRFDLVKMKKTWRWIQENMAAQARMLTENFQSNFLKAYEEGKVGSIEDPETYDWANLIRWTMANCRYTLPSLPQEREALGDYDIDISDYQIFNRPSWYKNDVAALNRSHNLHGYGYAAPLHSTNKRVIPDEDKELKARSWIRANISTPKALYDKKLAHDKLRPLGEPILEGVVQDLVEARLLRMWKIKRLRPGRNYNFTPGFALKYRRAFELKDFMAAVQLKKQLDESFAANRPFTISRTAEDGAVMAILTLAHDDRIRLVPKIPPIDNELGAPHPRISVWGFSEGDYVHRAIDRSSLFWEVQAIATDSYTYGSPLKPHSTPDTSHLSTDWESLPAPPMPGHDDANALLPIWSTIDGQHINYPWWYRILNLVVQSLMFQPGASAVEIFSHCPQHTTELFEVQLVIDWLEKVSAVKQNMHGTYEAKTGFWAVFGDKLIDEENDEFGENVKRKGKTTVVEPTWRTEYNLRFSTLQKSNNVSVQQENISSDEEESSSEEDGGQSPVLQQIMKNSRSQYHITKKALQKSTLKKTRTAEDEDVIMTDTISAEEAGNYNASRTDSMDNEPKRIAPPTESVHVVTQQADVAAAQIAPSRTTIDGAYNAATTPETLGDEGENSSHMHTPMDMDGDAEMEDVDAEGEVDEDYA
ncbi:hypothetical protein DM02DRAFT_567905 [Periconia macrospinosa]|uniref:Uncharacterized protein n=1 Tax=Periconia macrospinosa TaxID=97972 RepID=A0A2V1DH76_9PLEO|nr:hypothetical protein DM02DRAFT_567905 [Periconia macrospinosa]